MNATNKHTPGPWAYHGDHNRNHDRIVTHEGGEFGREQVALALDFNQFSRDDEANANARIIAAAPALLDMLEQILEHPDARIPCRTEAEAHALLRLARGS